MYDWSDSFWCAKRAQLGTDYLKLTECPSGYRLCSPGICMLTSAECPLTSVTLTSSPNNANSKQYGSSHYLTTYRVDGNAPLIDITVTENGIPCFSPDKTALGPLERYPLLNNQAEGCGRYGFDSQNSFWMDQRTEFALLNDNQFPQEVFHLPWYVDNLKGTVSNLSGRTRMAVTNKDFCQSMDAKIVDKLTKAVKKLNKTVSATSITAIAIHSVLIMALGIAVISIYWKFSCSELIQGGESYTWTWIFLFFTSVEIILFIIMAILVTIFRAEISEHGEYFQHLKKEGCFALAPSSQVIDDIVVTIEDIPLIFLKKTLVLLIITPISFVLVICLSLYRSKIERLQKSNL